MAGPLAGIKVLDFSALLPGPYGTMMLADLGAEVLRVAAPVGGFLRPDMPGGEPNPLDQTLARNKRCITLDLKVEGSREIVRRLVETHDVLLEQFRPGVMDRLGWGYEAARAVNPRIVYASLSGYGQTGPLRDRAGHDVNYLALSGLLSYTGRKDEGPALFGTQVADICAGSYNMVVGVLAALLHRNRTGEGQHVDVSMLDGSFALNAVSGAFFTRFGTVPGRETEMLVGGTMYDIYRTKDGGYLSVGGLEPKFLADFLEGIGHPELAPKGAAMVTIPNKAEAKRIVAETIASKTLAEWTEIFAARDSCTEPILDLKQAAEQPHAVAREFVVEMPNGAGEGTRRQIAHPIKFSATPPEYRHSGRSVGADNAAVLEEIGFGAAEIEALKAAGVFGK